MPQTGKGLKKRCLEVYQILYAIYGEVECPLYYSSDFQLLVSVMLSAQCTDERVNKTVPRLFAEYPDALSLSEASISDIEEIIKPIGLFHAKAKNIVAAAERIYNNFRNKIPDSIEELITIPGIGRKTANVIISHIHNGPGFAVDTHVKRVLNRLGIVSTPYPDKIELEIRNLMPPEELGNFSLLLIMHGRKTCKARNPACSACPLENICLKKIQKN